MQRNLLFSAVVAGGEVCFNTVAHFTSGALTIESRSLVSEVHSTEHINAILYCGPTQAVHQAYHPGITLKELAYALKDKSTNPQHCRAISVITLEPLSINTVEL